MWRWDREKGVWAPAFGTRAEELFVFQHPCNRTNRVNRDWLLYYTIPTPTHLPQVQQMSDVLWHRKRHSL